MSEELTPGARDRLLDLGAELTRPKSLEGARLGRYRIEAELGRGGMGIVYAAFDEELERKVAVKVLTLSAEFSESARARFLREAQAVAKLTHPNIAAVYDATPELIAMQLIEGVTLGELEDKNERLLATLLRDAALAVHYAHGQGVVHRDLKPANLMVERNADSGALRIYVMDFGLAKITTVDTSLSRSGELLGSPIYMPPEQARNSTTADERSDVYAIGATLYACLAGRAPFEGGDAIQVLRRTLEEEPPSLRGVAPGVDIDLATIVMKCLEKEPERRYASALALASDLDRWLNGEPILARVPSLAYVFRKFVVRQRGLFVTGAVAAFVTVSILGPIWLNARAGERGAEEALRLRSTVSAALEDSEDFSSQGDTLSKFARLEDGINACREFLTQHDIPAAHFMLGRLLYAHGRTDEAAEEFDRVLELNPADSGARLVRGLIFAERWRDGTLRGTLSPDEAERIKLAAESDLEASVNEVTDFKKIDVRYAAAELELLRGNLVEAEYLLQEVLDINPTHVKPHLSLAFLYISLGDEERSREHSVAAVDIMRGFGAQYADRVRAKADSPTDAVAARQLPDALGVLYDLNQIKPTPTNDALAFGRRGWLAARNAVRADDPVEALRAWNLAAEHYSSAMTVTSDPGSALVNRGFCHAQRMTLLYSANSPREARAARTAALTDFDEAIKLNHFLFAAWFNRGQLKSYESQLAAAAFEIESAVKLRREAHDDLSRAQVFVLPDSIHREAIGEALEALGSQEN